jgi:hypothetical protein
MIDQLPKQGGGQLPPFRGALTARHPPPMQNNHRTSARCTSTASLCSSAHSGPDAPSAQHFTIARLHARGDGALTHPLDTAQAQLVGDARRQAVAASTCPRPISLGWLRISDGCMLLCAIRALAPRSFELLCEQLWMPTFNAPRRCCVVMLLWCGV